MGIPDPKFGPDLMAMMRELDDTGIIEMVCAADKVWGERYGDDRTRVPRCACCHTNGFASGTFTWVVCKNCQHHEDIHGPSERSESEFTESRVRLLDQLSRFARHQPALAQWLIEVGEALTRSKPWPDPPQ